jgi:hypothetical protein
LVIAPLDPGDGSPAGAAVAAMALFGEKVAHGGEPTAYVCRGYACDEPTSDPQRARRQVVGLSRAGS